MIITVVTITITITMIITMITDLCEVVAVIDKVGRVHPVSRPLDMGLLVVEQRQYIIILQFHHEIAF